MKQSKDNWKKAWRRSRGLYRGDMCFKKGG